MTIRIEIDGRRIDRAVIHMSDGREVLVRCRVEDDGTESVEMQTEGPLVVLVGGPNQIRIGHRYVAPGWLAAQTEPT